MKEPTNQMESDIVSFYRNELKDKLGSCPDEPGYKKNLRSHQGWWRAFVLGLPEGGYYNRKKEWESVCNRIKDGINEDGANFLTENIRQAVAQTLKSRKGSDPGMIQEGRLNNNLLSSQPLAFNFFGEFMIDKCLGLNILQIWWPDITALNNVFFEFAPQEKFSNDNSAFDVAFEVEIGNLTGLIGLECKFTDSFSSTEYRKPEYFKLYSQSHSFNGSYEELTSSTYNQLFRNQLLAEGIVQNNFKRYSFVKTGLFCYPGDLKAIQTGEKFQTMLNDGLEAFKIITYKDFVENVQGLDLTWEQREWTMLLWARYLGNPLSERITTTSHLDRRKTLFIDMDNVLVDFQSGIDRISPELRLEFEGRLDEVPTIFGLMDPLVNATSAIEMLSKHFDTYILSTAPWKNPSAWSDKLEWVQKYFPQIFYKRLILTHHKDLCKGDFLIDDRTKNGAGQFSGEFIHFGAEKFPDWIAVTDYLLTKI